MHFLKEGQKIWAWVDPPSHSGNAQKKTFCLPLPLMYMPIFRPTSAGRNLVWIVWQFDEFSPHRSFRSQAIIMGCDKWSFHKPGHFTRNLCLRLACINPHFATSSYNSLGLSILDQFKQASYLLFRRLISTYKLLLLAHVSNRLLDLRREDLETRRGKQAGAGPGGEADLLFHNSLLRHLLVPRLPV